MNDGIFIGGHLHQRVNCSCGKLIVQCRCGNPNKPVVVRESSCPDCRRTLFTSTDSGTKEAVYVEGSTQQS